jgi:hypothetical protein
MVEIPLERLLQSRNIYIAGNRNYSYFFLNINCAIEAYNTLLAVAPAGFHGDQATEPSMEVPYVCC